MNLIKRNLLTGILNISAWIAVSGAGLYDDPFLKIRIPVPSKEKSVLYKTRSTTYYPNIVARIGLISTDLQLFNDGVQATFGRRFAYNIPFGGLSYYFPVKIRKVGSFDVNVDYSYFLHQDFKNGNLQEAELWGYAIGFGVGMDVFPSNKQFDFIISSGFQYGRLRYLFSNYTALGSTSAIEPSSKPFLAPQITLYPRWVMGYLVLGLRGSYHLDLLGDRWSGTPTAAQLGTASVNGWTVEAVIGIQLGIYR